VTLASSCKYMCGPDALSERGCDSAGLLWQHGRGVAVKELSRWGGDPVRESGHARWCNGIWLINLWHEMGYCCGVSNAMDKRQAVSMSYVLYLKFSNGRSSHAPRHPHVLDDVHEGLGCMLGEASDMHTCTTITHA